jgi:hypothetical protein
MTAAITHFVAVEVFGAAIPAIAGVFPGVRILTVVAVFRMEVVVDVAAEVVGTVEPGTGSDEDATSEPLRAIVTIGSAVVGRNIVVAVGTDWRYANPDGNLGLRLRRRGYCKTQTCGCR